MKETFWKAFSLVLLTCLIIVVASWASASQDSRKSKNKDKPNLPEYADQEMRQGVVVESNKQRYMALTGGSRGTDNEKIIIYDSWDLGNTQEVWYMKDCHTQRPKWVKIPFEKK